MRWRVTSGAALVGRAVPLRYVRRGLRAPLQVQLREDRADVVLDRLVGQEYLGRDLLVRLSLGHQEQDLLLLRRQLRKLVRGATGRNAANPLEHFLRDRGIEQ